MKVINLQDMFLNQIRKENIFVTIYLNAGVSLKGMVRGFDAFTVLLETPGKPTQLIYKHAISAILPGKEIPGSKTKNGNHEDGDED